MTKLHKLMKACIFSQKEWCEIMKEQHVYSYSEVFVFALFSLETCLKLKGDYFMVHILEKDMSNHFKVYKELNKIKDKLREEDKKLGEKIRKKVFKVINNRIILNLKEAKYFNLNLNRRDE